MKEFEYLKENFKKIEDTLEQEEEVVVTFKEEWKMLYIQLCSDGGYDYSVYSMDTKDVENYTEILDGGTQDEIFISELKELLN